MPSTRLAYAFFGLAFLQLYAGERIVETVLPALSYGPHCSSTINLRNLGDRIVSLEVEAHRSSGALVALERDTPNELRLRPGERGAFRADIADDSTGVWVKVRERIPSPELSPVLAISGELECIVGNELRTASREVSYPSRNPWFSGDAAALAGEVVSIINTSERQATASLCYASRTLYSVPGETPGASLQPLCISAFEVQVPPFGSRQFPVNQGGNSFFSIATRGDALALHMLRPVAEHVNLYTVDSTIVFGSEAPPR